MGSSVGDQRAWDQLFVKCGLLLTGIGLVMSRLLIYTMRLVNMHGVGGGAAPAQQAATAQYCHDGILQYTPSDPWKERVLKCTPATDGTSIVKMTGVDRPQSLCVALFEDAICISVHQAFCLGPSMLMELECWAAEWICMRMPRRSLRWWR
jgi:hypothetical protein